MKRSRRRISRRDAGQALPEYVILAAFIAMALVFSMGIFPDALSTFCSFLLHVVCGPL